MAEDTDFSASAVAFRIKFLLACFVMGKLDLQGKHNIMNNAKNIASINHSICMECCVFESLLY